MEFKHTPGPWSAGRGCVTSQSTLAGGPSSQGHDEVLYYGGHLIAESIFSKGDVHLIAAAPDLLEALQYALPYLERGELGMALDAIAKATGAQS